MDQKSDTANTNFDQTTYLLSGMGTQTSENCKNYHSSHTCEVQIKSLHEKVFIGQFGKDRNFKKKLTVRNFCLWYENNRDVASRIFLFFNTSTLKEKLLNKTSRKCLDHLLKQLTVNICNANICSEMDFARARNYLLPLYPHLKNNFEQTANNVVLHDCVYSTIKDLQWKKKNGRSQIDEKNRER